MRIGVDLVSQSIFPLKVNKLDKLDYKKKKTLSSHVKELLTDEKTQFYQY